MVHLIRYFKSTSHFGFQLESVTNKIIGFGVYSAFRFLCLQASLWSCSLHSNLVPLNFRVFRKLYDLVSYKENILLLFLEGLKGRLKGLQWSLRHLSRENFLESSLELYFPYFLLQGTLQ